MSKSFHISKAGEAKPCSAAAGNCPLSPADEHYSSAEEARDAYESKMTEAPVARKRLRFGPEDVRDALEEKGVKSEAEARKLFEKGFAREVEGLDEGAREQLFAAAYATTVNFEKRENWNSIFNEYAAKVELVKAVRASEPGEDFTLGEYGSKVFNANNRLGTLFHTFRTVKNLSPEQAKDALEGAYPLATSGLDAQARSALFEHAQERGAGDGWGAVAEEYSTAVDIALAAKSAR